MREVKLFNLKSYIAYVLVVRSNLYIKCNIDILKSKLP